MPRRYGPAARCGTCGEVSAAPGGGPGPQVLHHAAGCPADLEDLGERISRGLAEYRRVYLGWLAGRDGRGDLSEAERDLRGDLCAHTAWLDRLAAALEAAARDGDARKLLGYSTEPVPGTLAQPPASGTGGGHGVT